MLKRQKVLLDVKLDLAKFRAILHNWRGAVKLKVSSCAVLPPKSESGQRRRCNEGRKMSPPSAAAKLIPVVLSPSSRFVKWAILGVVTSALGYCILRQYSIAHCKSKDCQSEDPIKELFGDLKQIADEQTEMWLSNAKTSFFTKGILDAFDVIYEILDNLKEFGLSGEHYKSPRLILLGLIKRVQEEKYLREKQLACNDDVSSSDISTEQFEYAKHVGLFAINVYYASWLRDPNSIANSMGLESGSDVLFTWFQDSGDDHCPKFAIFVDRKINAIVLTIRGTFSLADAISDIVCDEDPFIDGFAHRGILNGAKKILKEAEPTVTAALKDHPDFDLIITGHSLGAGTAELIALSILFNKVDFIDPAKTNVKCIALAPPPVYRSDHKLPKEVKHKIEIYINNNDCVPRLSLAVIAKLLATMRAVDSLPLTKFEQLQILAGFKDQKTLDNLALIEEAMNGVTQEKFPYLQHPGVIFYLRRREDSKLPPLIERQKSKFFSSEILFLETMILDHLHMYYKEALAKVRLAIDDGTK